MVRVAKLRVLFRIRHVSDFYGGMSLHNRICQVKVGNSVDIDIVKFESVVVEPSDNRAIERIRGNMHYFYVVYIEVAAVNRVPQPARCV